MSQPHVAIVGAGIVGLAHAWSAAKRGHAVTVFERSRIASGASIRNFGMVWPIGQPAGERHQTALRSRSAWMELAREAGVWVNPCGSIHLAHRDDEWAVLEEFAASAASLGYDCQLLNAAAVLQRTPAANPDRLIGGLYSDAELCVNPRMAIAGIPRWLSKRFGVKFEFNTTIVAAETGSLRASDGRSWSADWTVICGGADIETLFPERLATCGLKLCKLQMLRTVPQPAGWRIGPHLASGLTLRHYQNFSICKSLPELRQRIALETPELDQFGIHVMASQNDQGEVVLGDSHEYDDEISPFDKSSIEELMLRELRQVIRLPDWTIRERWNGCYVKHPVNCNLLESPLPRVFLCTATGGAGMTMSFGLAEQMWDEWDRTAELKPNFREVIR